MLFAFSFVIQEKQKRKTLSLNTPTQTMSMNLNVKEERKKESVCGGLLTPLKPHSGPLIPGPDMLHVSLSLLVWGYSEGKLNFHILELLVTCFVIMMDNYSIISHQYYFSARTQDVRLLD